jgi:hypothetical protein
LLLAWKIDGCNSGGLAFFSLVKLRSFQQSAALVQHIPSAGISLGVTGDLRNEIENHRFV